MDFKVEGLWNTEKYCRPPWLADKKNFWILDALVAGPADVLKISQYSQESTCVGVSFFLRPATLLKRTPTQAFSCDYHEIFKSSFFYRTYPVAASVFHLLIIFRCYFTRKKILEITRTIRKTRKISAILHSAPC